MRSRLAARAAAVIAGAVTFVVVVAAPALATLDDGEVKGKSLGLGMTIVIFVCIPLGAFLLIAALASAPSLLRRPRYRPGRPWSHAPLWFNGPDDPDQAVASARPGGAAKGGASAEW